MSGTLDEKTETGLSSSRLVPPLPAARHLPVALLLPNSRLVLAFGEQLFGLP
jgi:hypothetical protein